MFCPKCGKDNYEQVRMCRSCGSDLGPIHLAIEGRLPDLSTLMNEEKRRRMLHRGIISTIAGASFLFVLLSGIIFAGKFFGGIPDAIFVMIFAFLSVPLLAYGIGSLISGRFVYNRHAMEYTQRFDVVREMLESQQPDVLPTAFPSSITEHLADPTTRQSEGDRR